MTVTVCIPAYRAGAFIAETVRSVLGQTWRDLKLVIAIDPPSDGSPDGTAAALARFAADPRLSVYANPSRLGWAENVNSLFAHIGTDFYCFLPHDDIWAPQYLEVLMKELTDHPDAVIAYADILRFGQTAPVRKGVSLPPDADRVTALLHFLAQGTEAHMWRGLTRSSVLGRVKGFPTDRHLGLVVECEYALSLFSAGAVRHVPRTLYFKRIYKPEVISASRERMLQPAEQRFAGWQEHARRMQIHLAAALADMQAGPGESALCGAALDYALLRRFQQFVTPLFGGEELKRAEAALAKLETGGSGLPGQIAAGLNLLLAWHWMEAGAPKKAEACRIASWQAGDTFASVVDHATALFSQNRPLEALERAEEAMRIGHLDDTGEAVRLIDAIYRKLSWTPD